MIGTLAAALGSVTTVSLAAGYYGLRRKGLDRWLGEYIRTRHQRRPYQPGEPLEMVLVICDHYEPKRGGVSMAKARSRVQEWIDQYPKLFDAFRDSYGNPPQHTFFYPEDEYEPELVEMVAGLCRRGYGDVEIHLHHDNDTADGLREKLVNFKTALLTNHGLLRKDNTGTIVYGFIHGNWCLDNSRRDGRYCGVNNEIDVLIETGCYADFTMPSAPSETQTRTINRIYWAVDNPERPKSHDRGILVGAGPRPTNSLLMVQGPLLLDWHNRKFGLLPAIENGNLQKSQPPTEKRIGHWLQARVNIPTRENTVCVKLHTHGVWEPNQEVLLGRDMVAFHQSLQALRHRDPNFLLRYATAYELAQMILT